MASSERLLIALIAAALAIGAALWLPSVLAAAIVAVTSVVMILALRASDAQQRARLPRENGALADAIEPIRDLVRLLEPLREGVLLLGEDQVVLAANGAAARILGRSPNQVTGVSLIRATRDHELVQLLRESSGLLSEISLADGRRVLAYATPFELGPAHTLLTLQDVTALRRAERARQDLVANVSHELRTPITAALALAETLEEGVDDEEQAARFRQRLTGELERLKEIVERLLRLSRIESEAEEFHIRPLEVDALVEESVSRMVPVAERAGVMIVTGEPTGLHVRADEARVIEVLTNLLDNAIRFSPAGGTVNVHAERGDGVARLTVRDQGPGILPSARLRVFERFYTGEDARTTGTGQGGTGLGLAIARHIISRLGGEIWVSEETPGATLCFTLPLAPAGVAAQ